MNDRITLSQLSDYYQAAAGYGAARFDAEARIARGTPHDLPPVEHGEGFKAWVSRCLERVEVITGN